MLNCNTARIDLLNYHGNIFNIYFSSFIFEELNNEYYKFVEPSSGKQGYKFSKDPNYVARYFVINSNPVPLMYKDDWKRYLWYNYFLKNPECLQKDLSDVRDPDARDAILHGLDSLKPTEDFLKFVNGTASFKIVQKILEDYAIIEDGRIFQNPSDLDSIGTNKFLVMHKVKLLDDVSEALVIENNDNVNVQEFDDILKVLVDFFDLPLGIFINSSLTGFIPYVFTS